LQFLYRSDIMVGMNDTELLIKKGEVK